MKRFEACYDRLVNSWTVAAAVVFCVFAGAALRLDDFPIYVDGLLSMATAGYFDPSSGLADVIDRLAIKSQQHVPGYFLVLHVWGKLVDWSPLALKLLSAFFGALSLALMYRVGRDTMGREAGLLATLMLASLTVINIWHLPIRMYTMFVAVSLMLLWFYLRLLRARRARAIDVALFCLSAVLFAYTHIFSLALLCGMGLHHLIFVPKTRKWLMVSGAFIVAALAFSPWLAVLIPGAEYAAGRAEKIVELGTGELLWEIIKLGINANGLFLLLFLLAGWQAWRRDKTAIALWALLLGTLAFYGLVNQVFGLMDFPRVRYAVIVFPLMILLMSNGLMLLAKRKTLLLIVIVFWLASGLLYQRRMGAAVFVRSYSTIPIHQFERRARDELREGDLLTGWSDGMYFRFESVAYGGIADFYFAEHGVDVAIEHIHDLGKLDSEEIAEKLAEHLDGRERVWLVYQPGRHSEYARIWHEVLRGRFFSCRVDDALDGLRVELHQASDCD